MAVEAEVTKAGHKEHTNFNGYHHYVGKVELGGNEYYVRFTLQEINTKRKDIIPNQLHSTFVSDVEIITLDANGRFLIPKRYLKMAHIEQDVRFIGMDNTIEIWAKEMTDKPFMAPETFEKELQKIMGTPIER